MSEVKSLYDDRLVAFSKSVLRVGMCWPNPSMMTDWLRLANLSSVVGMCWPNPSMMTDWLRLANLSSVVGMCWPN